MSAGARGHGGRGRTGENAQHTGAPDRFLAAIMRTYPRMMHENHEWRNTHTLVYSLPLWQRPLTNQLVYTHVQRLLIEYPQIFRISVQLGLIMEGGAGEVEERSSDAYFFYAGYNTELLVVFADTMSTRSRLRRVIEEIDLEDRVESVHMYCRGNSSSIIITNCLIAFHCSL